MHNAKVADSFNEIADLLELEDANPFRVRAYRNAARVIATLDRDVGTIVEKGEDLRELPGIGEHLAEKIRELVEHGHCAQLDRLRSIVPPGLAELLHVPGLGPRRVQMLYHDLGIETLDQLSRAARDGRIRALTGFGANTERRILDAVDAHRSKLRRVKLVTAAAFADALVADLSQVPGVERVVVAGSFRRMRETVGDLDLVVSAASGRAVIQKFVGYNNVAEVLVAGDTKASVRLRGELQVDLRVVKRESFGAALCYFTGSRAHSIALRRIAVARGLKLNEYGVFRGDERIAGVDEKSVYHALGLPLIAPELREDRGEFDAARAGRLPKLVKLADLRGDLHTHTRASDGHDTMRAMAEAAKARGLQYLAITEHSRHLAVANGLDEARLQAQCDEIDRLNAELKGITLLKSIEVDILEDGTLDLPDSVLSKLDLVVGAVHSQFNLSRERQTERVLRAMGSPHFDILAHPSGRLIGLREPYDVDMSRVIRRARERGCALELNAHPDRLDLLDIHCQAARAAGVPVAISSDAHHALEFSNLRFGVGQARRGWLEAKDVLNTRSLADLRNWLAERRGQLQLALG